MPENSLVPLSRVVALVSNRTTGSKDVSLPYVGLEHMPTGGSLLLGVGSAADSISTNGVFSSGDILFGKLRPQLRKCVRVQTPGYCSTDILVLRPNADIDPIYAGYVAQSEVVFGAAIRTEEGTKMPRCSWHDLKKVNVFLPKEGAVQKKIAAVLKSIDTTIEKTEALIAKHQQIKAGLMHDLFTRGVLPNGHLRPPRSEAPELYQETALGWIPRDWTVAALNDKVNPARPIVYGILMPGYGHPGGVPVVKVKDIRDRSIDVANLLLTSPAIDQEYRRSRLKGGDILFTIRGTVGRVSLVPAVLENANITQDTARIDLLGVSNTFISLFLESSAAKRFFEINTLGVAVQGINLGELRKLPIPVPSQEEQETIATRLLRCLEYIENEISKKRKLETQKLGLMQDLLTGRVPVPAAPEPAEAAA